MIIYLCAISLNESKQLTTRKTQKINKYPHTNLHKETTNRKQTALESKMEKKKKVSALARREKGQGRGGGVDGGADLFARAARGDEQHPLVELHLFCSGHHAGHLGARLLQLLLEEGGGHADHHPRARRLRGHVAGHRHRHLDGLVGVGCNNTWSCA